MSLSPTQLTLRKLRADGYVAEVVEKRVPHTNRTRDLFGVIDVLGVSASGTIGVQCTSASNVSARVKKIEHDDNAEAVAAMRDAGWSILVWGWRKKKGQWICREVDCS